MTITIDDNDKDLPDEIDDPVVVKGLKGYTIKGKKFSHDENEKDMLQLENCVECKVIDCTFEDKDSKGNFIHIKGEKTKGNIIEGCTFKDHTFDGDNGGEAIIIGLDEYSGCEFNTVVRKCKFENCRGDPEIISIKSCGNVLENNLVISHHDDARGNFTIRNGGFNTIQNNVFEGSAGIRVLGDGNKIIGNYHKNNGKKEVRPLAMENADVETDLNFENGKPSNKKGPDRDDTHYARAKNNLIDSNVYENCEGIAVVWGRADRDRKPQKNRFINNVLIADEKESRFLVVVNDARLGGDNGNTFEHNKFFGNDAKIGDLMDGAAEKLTERPPNTKPDAGP